MADQPARDWKARLYRAYVSSGQAQASSLNSARPFGSREHYWRAVIAKHFPRDRKSRIIDLGCGGGVALYCLKQAGYSNLAGVDVSAEQIAVAHAAGVSEAKVGDVDAYVRSLENESIDVVILFDVLEHLTRGELFETMDEVFRVLRPGGRCVLHVPNAEGLFAMRVRYGDLTHEQAFTSGSMRQLLATVGFCDIASYEDKPVTHGIRSVLRRAIWELGTLWPRLLIAAESGVLRSILSQNMLTVATRPA